MRVLAESYYEMNHLLNDSFITLILLCVCYSDFTQENCPNNGKHERTLTVKIVV